MLSEQSKLRNVICSRGYMSAAGEWLALAVQLAGIGRVISKKYYPSTLYQPRLETYWNFDYHQGRKQAKGEADYNVPLVWRS
ncbi:hypothetical protein BAUCODRAFT_37797 [Baudoinia panamericana UAMH 10762]|uniref:Uncharacterized protein n=1 Tax=Baudoinia panamericana (strain UAMH 10762) TaxID=717646 RepID=M2N2J1_BAUPA|nr:uncharacterized protein BAUCODRAFT_37797 [Baudoinia panamericana UAMH 10762]EMC92885.1 hypothetical protein BAUCODRAFT_37797 [Baudoinia panamericana UAMH 10762]